MKKIATGYFNSVFDMGNGKVLKKKNNILDRFKKIYSEELSVCKTIEVMRKIPKEHLSELEIQIMNKTYTGSLSLLANPLFENGGYTQDKVITIKEYFSKHSLEENKVVILKYIESIYQCWKNGIHEKVFNFTVNNGIDKQGNVVLIDFNETSQNKEDARKCIKSKRWLLSMSYLSLPGELKEFYSQQMERRITELELNRCFGKALR